MVSNRTRVCLLKSTEWDDIVLAQGVRFRRGSICMTDSVKWLQSGYLLSESVYQTNQAITVFGNLPAATSEEGWMAVSLGGFIHGNIASRCTEGCKWVTRPSHGGSGKDGAITEVKRAGLGVLSDQNLSNGGVSRAKDQIHTR